MPLTVQFRRALLLCVCCVLGACASRFGPSQFPVPTPQAAPVLHPARVTAGDVLEVAYYFRVGAPTPTYRIGVGDVLRLHVAEHNELNAEELFVLPDGTISLPLIGSLPAAGHTVAEVAAAAQRAYGAQRLRDPRVVVSVVRGQQKLRQFMQYLTGDRGTNRLQLTVFDADPVDLPFIPPVAVERPLAAIREEIRDAYAREFGDALAITVNLLRRAESTLYVMGEVKKPGGHPLTRPVNLLTAIALAGGFVETADEGSVLVVRFKPDNEYEHWTFDLKQGLFAAASPAAFQLRPNDVVYVARSPIADANLFVRQYIRGLLPLDVGVGIVFQPVD
jgi:polysaccharide biosynthesis/export protein